MLDEPLSVALVSSVLRVVPSHPPFLPATDQARLRLLRSSMDRGTLERALQELASCAVSGDVRRVEVRGCCPVAVTGPVVSVISFCSKYQSVLASSF